MRALEEEETPKRAVTESVRFPKDEPKWEDYRTDKKWSAERCPLGLASQRPSVGLLGGPVVKELPSSPGDTGPIPGHRAKMLNAAWHLGSSAAATEPTRCN